MKINGILLFAIVLFFIILFIPGVQLADIVLIIPILSGVFLSAEKNKKEENETVEEI